MTDYTYELAAVRRVVDGDTLDLTLERSIDFGFYLLEEKRFTARFRLLGVDTPERGQPGWAEATAFTSAWLADRAGRLQVVTFKADSFGRWLAVPFLAGDIEQVENLPDALLAAGLAVPYVR